MITKICFDKFTAFNELEIPFSEGINILIGENATGKTHIMKAIYAAACVIDTKEERTFDQKLTAVFRPNSVGRLVHRGQGRKSGRLEIFRRNDGESSERSITCKITTLNRTEIVKRRWTEDRRNPATYIPVKDMLANAPGFRSLYSQKHIGYEEIYADIIDRALIPATKGKPTVERARLLRILSEAISGRVIEKNETFYLKNASGELEFPLLAEGFRKLGLLYTLITNDSLISGSVLFWDEPEANLNPKLASKVAQVLVELQRMGVQIFFATHDYSLLKEVELASKPGDKVTYHSLYRKSDGDIGHESALSLPDLVNNPIRDSFDSLLDRELDNEYPG